MRQLIPVLFLCISSLAIDAQSNEIDWAGDLEYIKKELPQRHYDLFFQMPEQDFIRHMDELIALTPQLDDYQLLDRLLQILARVGDSHTRLDFGPFNKSGGLLPFKFYWYSDGMYITSTRAGLEKHLGHKVVAINGYPFEQVVDSLSTLIVIDNPSTARNTLPRMFGFVPHLEYFGFSRGPVIELTTEDPEGNSVTTKIDYARIAGEKIVQLKIDPLAWSWTNTKKFFTYRYIEEDAILHVQYNRCWSRELELLRGNRKRAKNMPSFKAFEKEVLEQIESQEVKKLIFDLRFNGGGSSSQGTHMIKKLAGRESINQEGKLFVVSGIHTFSSGIINLMDFKAHTHASFVGEITAGRPNHYGELKSMTLPSSGLRLSYSTKYFNNYKPDTDAFYPDVEIGTSFTDFSSGVDPVYEYIRKLK